MNKKRILIVGAGSRGELYGRCLKDYANRVEVVGVAEPREQWRQRFAAEHNLSNENIFTDWAEPLARDRIADAVILATPDHLHTAPAIAYANQGCHILLEKPMAPAADECHQIARAVRENGVMLAVCHVLRYAPYTQQLKTLLDSGCIGQPISIQHLEPVGYWHQAHSFVRGNWRNEAASSFMLLAKSCHDMDWLAYVMGAHAKYVSSFGNLAHFTPENAPDGAADRCMDCPVEADCPYSAPKIYLGLFKKGVRGWPLDVLTADVTEHGLIDALHNGPYGRCVYHCDNDVVDHQVVNIEFDNGATGVFTMTAFTAANQHRQTRIFGTRGELVCDCNTIRVTDFLTDQTTTHEIRVEEKIVGHAGGDPAMIERFVRALCENDSSHLLSGAEETLQTHLSVFAAEKARHSKQVVAVQSL